MDVTLGTALTDMLVVLVGALSGVAFILGMRSW